MRTYQYNNTQNTEQQMSEINKQNTLKLKNLVSTTQSGYFQNKGVAHQSIYNNKCKHSEKLKLNRRFSNCHSTNTTTCWLGDLETFPYCHACFCALHLPKSVAK